MSRALCCCLIKVGGQVVQCTNTQEENHERVPPPTNTHTLSTAAEVIPSLSLMVRSQGHVACSRVQGNTEGQHGKLWPCATSHLQPVGCSNCLHGQWDVGSCLRERAATSNQRCLASAPQVPRHWSGAEFLVMSIPRSTIIPCPRYVTLITGLGRWTHPCQQVRNLSFVKLIAHSRPKHPQRNCIATGIARNGLLFQGRVISPPATVSTAAKIRRKTRTPREVAVQVFQSLLLRKSQGFLVLLVPGKALPCSLAA